MSFIAAGTAGTVGLSAGLVGLSAGLGLFQTIKAGSIHPQYSPYQVSDYAKQRLGMAQQLYNGRMAGAANQEQNIANNQANTIASASRGASNGAQLLALGGAAQGQSNKAYADLGAQEAQNKMQQAQNLNGALDNMTAEEYKVYQDKLNQYQTQMQQKTSLMNAGLTNIGNAANSAYSMYRMGDFKGLFGGGGNKLNYDGQGS